MKKTSIDSKKGLPSFPYLFILFFLILLSPVFAVDVDFYDTYTGQQSSMYDKITWVDTFPPTYFQIIGVLSPSVTPIVYCVNEDRLIDSVFEFCIAKNAASRTLCSGVVPVYPVVDTTGASFWYNADTIDIYTDIGSGGNAFYETSKTIKRGQISYYSEDSNLLIDTGFTLTSPSTFDTLWLSDNLTINTDNINKVSVYIKRNSGINDLNFKIRSSLTGSDLVSKTITYSDISTSYSWIDISFESISVTSGNQYYFILECPSCSSNEYTWTQCDTLEGDCIQDYAQYSNDGGSSWSNSLSYRSLKVYESSCSIAGTTANSANYDYYFIDKTFNVCQSDRSNDYYIRGYYSTTQHILVDSETCATNLVCDTDHDGQESTTPGTKPTHPCKIDLDAPLQCSDSTECWNDNVCGGADFQYGGLCDGNLVDLVIEEYADNCGGGGVLVTIDTSDQDNSCNSKGYPSGYVCDETLDDIFYDTEAEVYSNVCRGGLGNSCTIDGDCYNAYSCISGFCGYGATASFTDDDIDNKIDKDDVISFDNSLSVSSDDDIKYSCWKVNGVNIECDGDNTECTTYCSGAFYDSALWDDGFIEAFTSGGNNIPVSVTIGSGLLYSDTYQELYCVSGDGFYCFTCNDGIKNDDEISIDWGGHCGFPYFIKCNNGILDGATNESSIDYGGSCGNCDNSSIELDYQLVFLIESGLIVYPFDNEQCIEAEQVQGGVVMFVLIVSALLIVPVILVILVLLVFIIFFGFGGVGLAFGVARRDTKVLKGFILDKINQNKDKKQ